MRKLLGFLCIICGIIAANNSNAQCTAAQLNWDNQDYYFNSGGSSPYQSYISDAQEQTQKFAIGKTWLSIATSSNALVNPGAGIHAVNATHTGDVTGYVGADVQYNPSAGGQAITITFNDEVQNTSFALYDVDANARIDIDAYNTANVAQNVDVTLQGSTILSITGDNSTGTYIEDPSTSNAVANSFNQGTAIITIPSSIKKIVLTVTTVGNDAVFWLSDINACVPGTFPTNYQQGANNRPFVGPTQNQADYFIVTPDNQNAYQMDPVTGKCWWLFGDSTIDYINSFAYDPYNRFLYYITEDQNALSTNKALRKYDFKTGTKSIVLNDIETSLGIPTMDQGIQSGGGAFYDGALYLGIEGGRSGSGSSTITRASTIWRIDFNASFVPVNAYKVFSVNAYKNASDSSTHDWGDFTIKNGVLYDFNTARAGSSPNYTYKKSSFIHYDLMTGNSTIYTNPTIKPYTGQAGLDWNGNMYLIRDSVAKYNEDGTRGTMVRATVVSGPAWVGSAGDASDPFRSNCDFGDAPDSYDPYSNPAIQSPAVHERTDNIRLGNTWNNEYWKKGTSGTEDTDDGLAYVTTFNPDVKTYLTQVSVYNNSGSNATVCAWLDFNGNGVFDVSEGITATVASSASSQPVWLYWPSAPSSLSMGTFTYLRIRITSASAGMTTSMPTGFFYNGEVEDYRVPVNTYPLAIQSSDFNARLTKDRKIQLTWSGSDESNISFYTVEKSINSFDWTTLDPTAPKTGSGPVNYEIIDVNVAEGTTYYRLKTIQKNGRVTNSTVKQINNKVNGLSISITPNPAKSKATVYINAEFAEKATLEVINNVGLLVYKQNVNISAGTNTLDLPFSKLVSGTYTINVIASKKSAHQFLIVNK